MISLGYPPASIKTELQKRYREKLDKILHFTAEQAGSTIALQNVAGTYKTSTDGKNWTDYTLGTTLTLSNIGDRVYFSARSQNETCWNNSYNQKFIMTGKIASGGNIQYLLNSTGARTDVPEHCYDGMFFGCSSLTKAPKLPATTLNSYCYSAMFYGCTSLSSAPELPATTLADQCYSAMFFECSSLTAAPVLPAVTLADSCYAHTFDGCISLTTAPALPVTSLEKGCYAGMFNGCTSLINAPELPATTLAELCYYMMFNGCSNLKIAIADPSITGTTVLDLPSETQTYSDWNYETFSGTGGTFQDDPSVGTKYICYQQLPSTLKVMLDWEASSTPANASLYINGVATNYNTSFEVTPGSALDLSVVCNESAYRFTRFSFEDPSVNHSAYNYNCSYTPSEGATEITAIFNQNWV